MKEKLVIHATANERHNSDTCKKITHGFKQLYNFTFVPAPKLSQKHGQSATAKYNGFQVQKSPKRLTTPGPLQFLPCPFADLKCCFIKRKCLKYFFCLKQLLTLCTFFIMTHAFSPTSDAHLFSHTCRCHVLLCRHLAFCACRCHTLLYRHLAFCAGDGSKKLNCDTDHKRR